MMNKEKERALLAELINLKRDDNRFLHDVTSSQPVNDYIDPARFVSESESIFQQLPQILAHSSELAAANGFLRCELPQQSLLLTRDKFGIARGFHNVCRHRGTRLVEERQGCRGRFSCPYHGWTWDNTGNFINGPHFDVGFPDLARDQLGLVPVPVIERSGLIWLVPGASDAALTEATIASTSPSMEQRLNEHLQGLADDLDWLALDTLVVHRREVQRRQCNWKMLIEGGIESYHFRVAHKHTIGALFNDTLSSYECFGPHIRSVLPRASIAELDPNALHSVKLREHTNVLYTLMAADMLLVQADHVVWIHQQPETTDVTTVSLTTLRPASSIRPASYWDKNHALTVTTLNEDFDLAESIHSGLRSGANNALHFGRFEGALQQFNGNVERYLSAAR